MQARALSGVEGTDQMLVEYADLIVLLITHVLVFMLLLRRDVP